VRQATKALTAGAILAVIGLLLVAAPTADARPTTSQSAWYWTPGGCKSELQSHGVELGDGRTFNVAKAYCVGLHNHCWLKGNAHLYKVFVAVVRSYDGVVREFQLTVVGHHSWRGTKMKSLGHMSPAEFTSSFGTAAWSVASVENQGGCLDIHP